MAGGGDAFSDRVRALGQSQRVHLVHSGDLIHDFGPAYFDPIPSTGVPPTYSMEAYLRGLYVAKGATEESFNRTISTFISPKTRGISEVRVKAFLESQDEYQQGVTVAINYGNDISFIAKMLEKRGVSTVLVDSFNGNPFANGDFEGWTFIDAVPTKADGAVKLTQKTIEYFSMNYEADLATPFSVPYFYNSYEHIMTYDPRRGAAIVDVRSGGAPLMSLNCIGGFSVNGLAEYVGWPPLRGKTEKAKNPVKGVLSAGAPPSTYCDALLVKTITDWAQMYYVARKYYEEGVPILFITNDSYCARIGALLKLPYVLYMTNENRQAQQILYTYSDAIGEAILAEREGGLSQKFITNVTDVNLAQARELIVTMGRKYDETYFDAEVFVTSRSFISFLVRQDIRRLKDYMLAKIDEIKDIRAKKVMTETQKAEYGRLESTPAILFFNEIYYEGINNIVDYYTRIALNVERATKKDPSPARGLNYIVRLRGLVHLLREELADTMTPMMFALILSFIRFADVPLERVHADISAYLNEDEERFFSAFALVHTAIEPIGILSFGAFFDDTPESGEEITPASVVIPAGMDISFVKGVARRILEGGGAPVRAEVMEAINHLEMTTVVGQAFGSMAMAPAGSKQRRRGEEGLEGSKRMRGGGSDNEIIIAKTNERMMERLLAIYAKPTVSEYKRSLASAAISERIATIEPGLTIRQLASFLLTDVFPLMEEDARESGIEMEYVAALNILEMSMGLTDTELAKQLGHALLVDDAVSRIVLNVLDPNVELPRLLVAYDRARKGVSPVGMTTGVTSGIRAPTLIKEGQKVLAGGGRRLSRKKQRGHPAAKKRQTIRRRK
jgi:hypothetical protein